MKNKRIAILGTVGVPANYGGFETLVENLIKYHDASRLPSNITVYCSSKSYPTKNKSYLLARLKYIHLNANGIQSILYDTFSLFSAVWYRNDVILLLGVSGAIVLPFIQLISSARIITHIDGIEWRRQKWRGFTKSFLRFSEKIAVRYSDDVISDNDVITDYLSKSYGVESHMIPYGGDHAVAILSPPVDDCHIPARYAFSVCRIEPENNVHFILEAFSLQEQYSLIMVGNWDNSAYGRELRENYAHDENLYLFDPIYDLGKLKTLRSKADFYIHGHSAGGTNPSLVEAMHFGVPILAFDCDFNRSTTENKALYFKDSAQLVDHLKGSPGSTLSKMAADMQEIANRRYTWAIVAQEYFSLL